MSSGVSAWTKLLGGERVRRLDLSAEGESTLAERDNVDASTATVLHSVLRGATVLTESICN